MYQYLAYQHQILMYQYQVYRYIGSCYVLVVECRPRRTASHTAVMVTAVDMGPSFTSSLVAMAKWCKTFELTKCLSLIRFFNNHTVP
eukprot:SAG11_NODE_82_length_17639_cov_6.427594_1_plen_87_part_00